MDELNAATAITPSPAGKGRQKKAHPEAYKRNVAKSARSEQFTININNTICLFLSYYAVIMLMIIMRESSKR